MCIYCDYCVYHYESTELVSLYTLDIGLKLILLYIYNVLLTAMYAFLFLFSLSILKQFYCMDIKPCSINNHDI